MRRIFCPNWVRLVVFISLISVAATESMAQRPSIELLDVKASATQSAISLAGQVKNISPSDVRGVTVYCDFQNAAGKVVRTEQTNLKTDPLAPNKLSDFECSTKSSQDIKGYNFRFDRLFGGPLAIKDSRPKK